MKVTIFLLVLLAIPLVAQQTERRYTHSLLAQGIAASAPMTVTFRTVSAQMVLRNFVVGRGVAKDIPTAGFAVMELHVGHVFTTIAGDRQERVPGDFWTVDQGATITFENPEAQSAAVIRVMSFDANR
jgi:hypothetical protein